MERILVTGATGRLGANLVKALLAQGCEVRAFVMKDDPQAGKLTPMDYELYYGDFLAPVTVERAVEGCDRVIHIGTVMYRPAGMSELTYWNLNVTGTFALVRACIKHQVKRLVYASTDSTYTAFNYDGLPIRETHPQRPNSLYGIHKMCGEQIVFGSWREAALPAVVTRFSSIMVADEILNFFTMRYVLGICRGSTGSELYPRLNPDRLPGMEKPVEEAMEDPLQLCIPRGPDMRSWRMPVTDVRDIVQGVMFAAFRDEAVGEAFNIAYPRAFTWEEIVKYIARKTGRDYTDLTLGILWEYELCSDKAARLLGFEAKYDFRAMIDDAFRCRAGEDIGVIPGASYFA